MRFEAWLLPVFLAARHGLSGWLIEKKAVPTNASRVALYVTLPLAFAVLWSVYCYCTYAHALLFFQHQTVATNFWYFEEYPHNIGYSLASLPGVALFCMGPPAAGIAGLTWCMRGG